MSHYETIIKVHIADPPSKRARDIERGIRYAFALLRDEYGRTDDYIERLLDDVRVAA